MVKRRNDGMEPLAVEGSGEMKTEFWSLPYAARQQIRLGEAQGARANNISVSADRMRQALLSIANSQCCDTCNEAKKVARDALGMPYD